VLAEGPEVGEGGGGGGRGRCEWGGGWRGVSAERFRAFCFASASASPPMFATHVYISLSHKMT
jgi:hypothetical protein